MIYIIEQEHITTVVTQTEFEAYVRFCKEHGLKHGLNWVVNKYGNLSRELVITGGINRQYK